MSERMQAGIHAFGHVGLAAVGIVHGSTGDAALKLENFNRRIPPNVHGMKVCASREFQSGVNGGNGDAVARLKVLTSSPTQRLRRSTVPKITLRRSPTAPSRVCAHLEVQMATASGLQMASSDHHGVSFLDPTGPRRF